MNTNWLRDVVSEALNSGTEQGFKDFTEEIISNAAVDGSEITFVLTGNNITCHEPCAVCGQDHKDADIPYWIFLMGGGSGICFVCVSKYVPLLLKAAQTLNRTHYASDLIKTLQSTVKELVESFQVGEDDEEPLPF